MTPGFSIKLHGMTGNNVAENLATGAERYGQQVAYNTRLAKMDTATRDKTLATDRETAVAVGNILADNLFTQDWAPDLIALYIKTLLEFFQSQTEKGINRRDVTSDGIDTLVKRYQLYQQSMKRQVKKPDEWKSIHAGLFAFKVGQPVQMASIEQAVLDAFYAKLMMEVFLNCQAGNLATNGPDMSRADAHAKMTDFTGVNPAEIDEYFALLEECHIPDPKATYGQPPLYDMPKLQARSKPWMRYWNNALGGDIVQCDASHTPWTVMVICIIMTRRVPALADVAGELYASVQRVMSSWTAGTLEKDFRVLVYWMMGSGANLTFIYNCFHSLTQYCATMLRNTIHASLEAAKISVARTLRTSFVALAGDDILLLPREPVPGMQTFGTITSPMGVGIKNSPEPGAAIFCHTAFSPAGAAVDAFRMFYGVLQYPAADPEDRLLHHRNALFTEFSSLRNSDELKAYMQGRLARYRVPYEQTYQEIALIQAYINTPVKKLAELRALISVSNINQYTDITPMDKAVITSTGFVASATPYHIPTPEWRPADVWPANSTIV